MKHWGRADSAAFHLWHLRPAPVLDKVLPVLARAADHGVLWVGVAGALAATRNVENRRAALRGLCGLGIASTLANGPVKYVVRRPRPAIEGVALIRRLRRQPLTYSFPSGHSASAAAFAAGVMLERPKLGVGIGLVAGGVALSRLHTGVHYPGDIAAGVALGVGSSLALTRIWPPRLGLSVREKAPAAALPALEDGAGLVVVANHAAGSDEAEAVARRVAEVLPAAKLREVLPEEDLTAVLAESVLGRADSGEGIQALGIAGGDGSVNAAASAALEAGLPLVVIPAGTLNHFARELGVPSIDGALQAVRAGSGACVDVAAATVDGGGREIFLNTASVGAYPEVVVAREQLEERLGKWPAMVVALVRILREAEPVHVEVDGERRRLWLLFAGNCVYSPPGFAPSWRERLDDGLLDLRLVDATRPYSRTRLIAAVCAGRLARSPVFETRTAERVRVRSLRSGVRLARDGEVGDPVEGFVLHKAGRLRVYRP
jgi:diacylglycerol kinase family enzyme/membrane-associated phospholipid phosphatase